MNQQIKLDVVPDWVVNTARRCDLSHPLDCRYIKQDIPRPKKWTDIHKLMCACGKMVELKVEFNGKRGVYIGQCACGTIHYAE